MTELVRQQIVKRSIRVFTGIGQQLRQGDLNGDGLLNKFELEKSLVDFRITLPQRVSYIGHALYGTVFSHRLSSARDFGLSLSTSKWCFL